MARQAFVILVSGLLLVAVSADAAQALPKSFCRRWAAGVANNNLDYAAQARELEQAGPDATLVIKPGEPDAEEIRSLSGGGLGGFVARFTKPSRWNEIYKQAYARCRVFDSF